MTTFTMLRNGKPYLQLVGTTREAAEALAARCERYQQRGRNARFTLVEVPTTEADDPDHPANGGEGGY